ncbi:MAG: TFIIB-type zinc ribbon-containing protein [Gaiellaceae bacterium]
MTSEQGSDKRSLRCPVDGATMVEVERNGVLIDACPRCRGVWLDRGELDKLIEQEQSYAEEVDEDFLAEIQGGAKSESSEHRDKHDDKHGHSGEEYGKKKKKKGSFLADFLEM